MTVLIAYGSRWGGTEELAQMVAEELRVEALAVDVVPARQVKSVTGYEAVVIGGGLYGARWHRDARWFVKHHREQLRNCPTYLFSSGPLNDSVRRRTIVPVRSVQAAMESVVARGHVTFGGRLSPEVKGFPARAMARKHVGDWRDRAQVRTWAQRVASELQTGAAQ
ncbi:MAG TPA: flavodoxin domain-containing protein [Acidimicrobiales bacterium]|nr:flavodoxin domain-containing protein [Acidimicrobiales bacterium]